MCNDGYGIDCRELPYNPFINEKTYKGNNYKVAGRIQQLRLQMLVHSHLYYYRNKNRISDREWDARARELRDLQNEYPEESRIVPIYYEAFKDWDATTGCMLPLNDPWVVRVASGF